MMDKRQKGGEGEAMAAVYLKGRGYSIVKTNFLCRSGEIDLIASKVDEIHFVEVKCRTSPRYGAPVAAVNYYKQQRMIRAAQYYLAMNDTYAGHAKYFSVIGIDQSRRPAAVLFYPNAFGMDERYY